VFVAPVLRGGTGRHTFKPYAQRGIHFFPPLFEIAVTFDRSGGPPQKDFSFFNFFSPLVACTICALCGARNAYRCSNAASVLFFSHRRRDTLVMAAVLENLDTISCRRRSGDQGEALCAEPCCLLIRSLGETFGEQRSRRAQRSGTFTRLRQRHTRVNVAWRIASCGIVSRD